MVMIQIDRLTGTVEVRIPTPEASSRAAHRDAWLQQVNQVYSRDSDGSEVIRDGSLADYLEQFLPQ